MINTIGYIGSMLLAFCALPQAISSAVSGHSLGISGLFLWTWFLGEVCLIVYTAAVMGMHNPLFLNYMVNTVLVGIILKYKYYPRIGRRK